MTDRDLSKLHGDELTWALDSKNEVRWTRIEIMVFGLYVLLVGMRAAPNIVGFASAHGFP